MNQGPSLSQAVNDLGLGGALQGQVQDETEEMRKRRMQQMQFAGLGASPAASALFGGPTGAVRSY